MDEEMERRQVTALESIAASLARIAEASEPGPINGLPPVTVEQVAELVRGFNASEAQGSVQL